MSAQEYLALRAAYPAKKKVPKRQQETVEVKSYIKFLNDNGFGFFFRVKTAGTFDPVRKIFRKNNDLTGVPDICGYSRAPLPAFIECKRVLNVERKKKLTFKVVSTNEQKKFLLDAHRAGCLAGYAFNLKDCISILMQDEARYPRHPRTYAFLPKEEHEAYAEKYRELIKAHAENAQDPVTRHVLWAGKKPTS